MTTDPQTRTPEIENHAPNTAILDQEAFIDELAELAGEQVDGLLAMYAPYEQAFTRAAAAGTPVYLVTASNTAR